MSDKYRLKNVFYKFCNVAIIFHPTKVHWKMIKKTIRRKRQEIIKSETANKILNIFTNKNMLKPHIFKQKVNI